MRHPRSDRTAAPALHALPRRVESISFAPGLVRMVSIAVAHEGRRNPGLKCAGRPAKPLRPQVDLSLRNADLSPSFPRFDPKRSASVNRRRPPNVDERSPSRAALARGTLSRRLVPGTNLSTTQPDGRGCISYLARTRRRRTAAPWAAGRRIPDAGPPCRGGIRDRPETRRNRTRGAAPLLNSRLRSSQPEVPLGVVIIGASRTSKPA
jgi:hypothetical protein